jgi:hypothetical protein
MLHRNIWKAAAACLEGATQEAKAWFRQARHILRHEDSKDVLRDIRRAMKIKDLPESSRDALSKLYDYLNKHRKHMDYKNSKSSGCPSAVGWWRVLANGSFSRGSREWACGGVRMASIIFFT